VAVRQERDQQLFDHFFLAEHGFGDFDAQPLGPVFTVGHG
jgi:hypothetical protein